MTKTKTTKDKMKQGDRKLKTKLDEKAIQLRHDENYKSGYGCDAKWVGNILDEILFEMEEKKMEVPRVLVELKQHLRFKGNDNPSDLRLWKSKAEQITWQGEKE
jgi:hypothetical protein